MNQQAKTYVDRINELQARIVEIKSVECIMDYDDKTEAISFLKSQINALANTQSMMIMGDVNLTIKEKIGN